MKLSKKIGASLPRNICSEFEFAELDGLWPMTILAPLDPGGGNRNRLGGRSMEDRRAESGGGLLGEGQLAPSPPATGSGELCKLPQRV